MAVIEAMSQGLPVIASDIGGPRDIIQHGQNGLLVRPGDHLMFADAIENLLKSPSLAISIGSAAIKTISEKYLFDHMLDKYESYLYSFIQKKL